MDSDLPSVDLEKHQKDIKFDFDEFLFNFRKPLITILGGLILIGVGLIFFKSSSFLDSSKVEVIKNGDSEQNITNSEVNLELVVEISGAVQSPGVYKLRTGSRVDDLLIVSGGVSGAADRDWVEKNINRAAKLADGQKLYVPSVGEKLAIKSAINKVESVGNVAGMTRTVLVNINTASQKELEDLPGIGPVYAQSIIEKRIYSSVEELLSKGALKKSVYEKLKGRVTVN